MLTLGFAGRLRTSQAYISSFALWRIDFTFYHIYSD